MRGGCLYICMYVLKVQEMQTEQCESKRIVYFVYVISVEYPALRRAAEQYSTKNNKSPNRVGKVCMID